MAKSPANPPDKQQQLTSINWSGPLPPPAALEHFDRVIPGGAERILAMAEKEQAHRISLEQAGLQCSIGETRRGQWLGAFVSLVDVGGAIAITLLGKPWHVALALVSIPVCGIAVALINRRSIDP